MVAQASRTSARYPTRSIDYPSANYGSPTYAYTSPTVAWSAPRTMVPSTTTSVANSAISATPVSYNYAASPATNSNPTAVGTPPSSITVGNGTVYSSALVPVPSALVASNPMVVPQSTINSVPMGTPMIPAPMNNAFGYPAYPYYPYAFAPNGSVPTAYPPYGANPYGANPYASWMTSTGALFSTNMFQTQSMAPVANTAMVPNTPAYASNAPNFWGRSAPTTMPPTFGTYPPNGDRFGNNRLPLTFETGNPVQQLPQTMSRLLA